MTPQPAPRPGGEPVTPAARHCCLCGADSSPRLTVVPACELHSHPDEVAAALNEWRDEMMLVTSALSRWLTCRDVYGSIKADDPSGVDEAAAGLQDATDNLERVARKVFG